MTRGKAEAMLSEILEPINKTAGEYREHVYSFSQFVEGVYLPVYREKWKASTRMTEEGRLRVHLVNSLDSQPIQEITRKELQSLLGAKAKVLSQSVVDHLRFRLRSVFQLALSEGVVDRNPAMALYTPRHCRPARERRVLTPAQIASMLEALDLRERLVARLATWEGMRPGEILGLKIGDCGSETVSVRRRVYRGNIDVPKTRRSIREVALSNGSIELLQVWIDQVPGRGGGDWVFPSEVPASPMSRDNIWWRNMRPKLDQAGLEWVNFQVMRRTFATLSRQIGIDAHTRSAQMGNTVHVNENEYAISSVKDRVAAVRQLESALVN